MVDKRWLIVLAVVAFLQGQLLLLQYQNNNLLQSELSLTQQARRIDADELREVLYHLTQARSDQAAAEIKNFVAGVAAAVTNPEKYQEVWHAGYDRGSAVHQYAAQLENAGAVKYTSENKQQ